MSFRAKRELLVQVAPRYRAARHGERSAILDEFIAVTGYDRKYAIRVLLGPIQPPAPIRRPRRAYYGREVQEALASAWLAANGICAKRLVPFLVELIPTLERHGHLSLTDEVREQLLAVSSATADRLLRPLRHPHGLTTTKPGRLLKKQIPIRTFTEWNDVQPGFLEADLVAHCGGSLEGAFLYTLTLTDVATTWTECLPLLHRTQHGVVHAVQRARGMFPFALLGIDTDNGSEFINEELLAYCTTEQLTFTRGRVANKNDQCYVEQKNGSVVRQLVGYDRFEGERAYRQLAELYRAVRLYVNFFQPSMKLRTKTRTGSRVRRTYGRAQTPFQRVLASGVLDLRKSTSIEIGHWTRYVCYSSWRRCRRRYGATRYFGRVAARRPVSSWRCASISAHAVLETMRRLPRPSSGCTETARRNASTDVPRNRRDRVLTVAAPIRSQLCGTRSANG